MAKPIGPLFSVEAHGQIGKGLIFSKRRSGQMVRLYHKPTGDPSSGQIAQRALISALNVNWHAFSSAEKKVYNDMAAASRQPITGYDLYIRLAQSDLFWYYGLELYGSPN